MPLDILPGQTLIAATRLRAEDRRVLEVAAAHRNMTIYALLREIIADFLLKNGYTISTGLARKRQFSPEYIGQIIQLPRLHTYAEDLAVGAQTSAPGLRAARVRLGPPQ